MRIADGSRTGLYLLEYIAVYLEIFLCTCIYVDVNVADPCP